MRSIRACVGGIMYSYRPKHAILTEFAKDFRAVCLWSGLHAQRAFWHCNCGQHGSCGIPNPSEYFSIGFHLKIMKNHSNDSNRDLFHFSRKKCCRWGAPSGIAKCKRAGCGKWQEHRLEDWVRGTPNLVTRPPQNHRFLLVFKAIMSCKVHDIIACFSTDFAHSCNQV